MSYRQEFYCIPNTPLGESFRGLINNTDLLQDRRCLLANLKNTAFHFFHRQNILSLNCTDTEGRVRYIAELCSRPWGMKGPERMWCEGIAIPLRPRDTNIHSGVELCIAGGNGQLWSTKPTVGLRYKSPTDGSWSDVRWFGTRNALWLQLRHDALFREITSITEWSWLLEPGMVQSGLIKDDPDRFKDGFRIEGSGTPQLRMGDLYAATTKDADALVRFLSPGDRIDFTQMQMALANGFSKSDRPLAAANMLGVAISALCGRCRARYGNPDDPKKINFLQADLDDPENPWLPGKTADETYLWMVDYIYGMLGDCESELLAKPIADAIGEPLLIEMERVIQQDITIPRAALVANLRKANAQTAE